MNSGSRKRIRILGKILFVLYIIFIIYFLLFSDWYGRTGQMQEYHYNLVLFKEIKILVLSGSGRHVCNIYESVWKCCDFYSVWIFYADGKQTQKFSGYIVLQFRVELVR